MRILSAADMFEQTHKKVPNMNLLKFILFFAGFYVILRLLHYLLIVKTLLGLRFKRPGGELKDPRELPEYLRNIFDTFERQLEALGFTFLHSQIFDSCVATAFSRQWNMVYFNGSNCYANVTVAILPEPHDLAKVEFVTIFADGTRLVTVNGMAYDIIGETPDTTIVDPYAPTLDQQFTAHVENLNGLAGKTISVTPPDFLAGEVKNASAYVDWLIQHGYLKSEDNKLWRLRLVPAIQHAFKSIRGLRKVNKLRASQRKIITAGTAEPVDVPVEVEVSAYLRVQEVLKPSDSGLGYKLMVFVVSLVLGISVFGVAFSFKVAFWLVAALFVHELGHYLGMAIFRFSDRQILFLPFIGAATLGTKTDATALQRAVVYMLGPAVGLGAGSVCLIAGIRLDIDSLKFCGAFFLILNYLNLLPIVPLDGGRLFELALFSRLPILKSAFYIISLAAFAIGALLLRDPVLAIIVLPMLLGTRTQILLNLAHSKLNKQIKTNQLERTQEALLPEVFRTLKQKAFAKLPFIRRYAISHTLLNNLLQKPPDLAAMIVSLLFYIVTILLPAVVAISAGFFIGLAAAI